MAEPQLSIRSAKAKTLAHALALRTGLSVSTLVERALEHYQGELLQPGAAHAIDSVWALAAAGREGVAPGAISAHDDLYDENGLPR